MRPQTLALCRVTEKGVAKLKTILTHCKIKHESALPSGRRPDEAPAGARDKKHPKYRAPRRYVGWIVIRMTRGD